jgi:ATP-dependent DNA helicase RecG
MPPKPQFQSLTDPVTALSGVGPKKANMLARVGIRVVKDFLNILPRTYQNRHPRKIKELDAGETAIVVAHVLRAQFMGYGRTRRLQVLVKDDSGHLKLVFFNTQTMNLERRFLPNSLITIVGTVTAYGQLMQMSHPRVYNGDVAASLEGICAIYPEVKGIYSTELSKFIQAALQHINTNPIPDIVPTHVREQAGILPLAQSYQAIHHPVLSKREIDALIDQSHPAFRRMAFDEILALQLIIQRRRLQISQHQANAFKTENTQTFFKELLLFAPTKAQTRVFSEISADLSRTYPMMRLLQGDVGAGKTAIAACSLFLAAKNMLQSAIMVPTEILAAQHYQTLKKILEPHGIKVILLTSSTTKKERESILNDLKEYPNLVAVGTHALITEDVNFKNLSLIIIDEQHRFGVEQRTALLKKGRKDNLVPHILAMTATPIPRSLALTLYGDFAISILDELPPGRTPIVTRILFGDPCHIIQMLAKNIIDKDEQAYIVYPLVEESEKIDLQDAKRAFDMLVNLFDPVTVALIHGRMKAREKEKIMQRFIQASAKILISTTVIEVGVDVPNATNIIIVHAERFGLSQLHQLRGRVGRGHKKSTCFLVTEKLQPDKDAYRRLSLMEKTSDGFLIANEDLNLRGPGDFLGTRQSGLPLFRFCDFSKHADLIEHARNLAINITSAPKPNEQFSQ